MVEVDSQAGHQSCLGLGPLGQGCFSGAGAVLGAPLTLQSPQILPLPWLVLWKLEFAGAWRLHPHPLFLLGSWLADAWHPAWRRKAGPSWAKRFLHLG